MPLHFPEPHLHVDGWWQIDFSRLYKALESEKNADKVHGAIKAIQKFAHNYRTHADEKNGYLVRFNDFAFQKMEELDLSERGKQIFAQYIEDSRHNLEMQIGYSSPSNFVSYQLSGIRKRFEKWFASKK